jgi:hypothetical protein
MKMATDLHKEIARYAKKNGYPAAHFADAKCKCGGRTFTLALDDTEGAAVRRCTKCKKKHAMGDSAEFLADATLEDCECPCGKDIFEITAGVALYEDSEDVRWLYIGCRCPSCGLAAIYGDWKNEYDDYRALLAKM